MSTVSFLGKTISALTLGVAVTGCAVTPAAHYDVYDYEVYHDARPVYVYPSTRVHIYERYYDGYPRRSVDRRIYVPQRRAYDRDHDRERDHDRDRDHGRDRDRGGNADRPNPPRADTSGEGAARWREMANVNRRRSEDADRASSADRARRGEGRTPPGQSAREDSGRRDRASSAFAQRSDSRASDTRAYKDDRGAHSRFTRDR
jgi:hypothetical protein